MLYMVEMDLPDRSRVDDWHGWYAGHIGKLLTVDGYFASQRFEALGSRRAPFLAVHDVSGPELFAEARYGTVGGPSGTGEWQKLMTNWSRNLFDGCVQMPEVGADEVVVLVDDPACVPASFADRATCLTCVGLDRSIPERAFFVLRANEDRHALAGVQGIDLFRPITGKLR